MPDKKILRNLGKFSLQFPPINGVECVQFEDYSIEFVLRYEESASKTVAPVVVTEGQLDLILRLVEMHRKAHAAELLAPAPATK